MLNRKPLSDAVRQSRLVSRLQRLRFVLHAGDHLLVAQRAHAQSGVADHELSRFLTALTDADLIALAHEADVECGPAPSPEQQRRRAARQADKAQRAAEQQALADQREQAVKAYQKAARAAQKQQKIALLRERLPSRNPQRLRYLASLIAADRQCLERSGAITGAEHVAADQAKKDALLTSYVAQRLGVRASDVDRWDQEGRLPHAWTKTAHIQGRATVVRVWLAVDVEAVRETCRDWLIADITQGRIRLVASTLQMLARWGISLPAAFQDKARQISAAQTEKARRDWEEHQQALAQQETARAIAAEKRQRQQERQAAYDQQVARALALTDSHHWSQFFPNPQLGVRRLEAYLGPTNSGKTYQALQALKTLAPHEQGVYLAPLRLLAIEVCEELRAQGVAVSLVTGEERDIDPQARVVCSTIEMLDPNQSYAVGVIDELQMITDPQRGWAWTQALFELSADRLFVLGSPSVEPLLQDFAALTGDTLTVHRTQRFNPLQVLSQPRPPKAVQPGTIFVVFSRNAVIRWGEYFRSAGRSVALIYGAMPPEVRRDEARRFRAGEADILVATDAVAMGLNLPAHTVVLGEREKYNGSTTAAVPLPLVRQIAGRAGRYGHHDAGFAGGADPLIHRHLQDALKDQDDPFTFPLVPAAPTHHWVAAVMEEVPTITVRGLLTAWQKTLQGSRWFRCVDLGEMIGKATILDDIAQADRLPMIERLQILTAPANARAGQMGHFRTMVMAIVANRPLPAPTSVVGPRTRTEDLESAYKHLSLYCWFHYRYPQACPDIDKAIAARAQCVSQLIAHIRRGLKRHCKQCGQTLPAKSGFGTCESCHQKQRWHYSWDRDDNNYY